MEALYRKVASTGPPEDSSHPLQQQSETHLLETETAAPEEPVLPDRTDDDPIPKKEGSANRILFTAIGLFFTLSLLCMVAIFFWPTIYYYESLNLGEKVYPLRINKLTGEISYFNGTLWLSPPVAETAKKPVYGNLNNPAAIIPPATNSIKAPVEEPTAAPALLKTRDKGKYVIQIKSFPENSKKDAQTFMEDVKKRVPEIQMKTVQIAGHGVWYRIWVGNFSTLKEASHTMKKLKLSDSYPDSFIRKQSGE
ncbi:MAG: SPOR domain-containing protein [Syntrophales bacterium]